jgi:ribosome-associated translation inhibitor RaiA
MEIEIRTRRLTDQETPKAYCEKRLRSALGRFAEQVERVVVSLSDINGPRGGEDKKCVVRVHLRAQNLLVVSSLSESMHAALDLAADRAGRSVSRRLELARPHEGRRARLKVA